MSQRTVPPLPSRKPPVPTGFKLRSLLSEGGISSMLPALPSFTGGAATALGGAARGDSAASNMGSTGNIGRLTFAPVYKGKSSLTTFVTLGAVVFLGYMIVKRVF